LTAAELAKLIDDGESVRETSFAGADLAGGAYLGAMFEKVDFRGTDLRDATLTAASFMECDLTGAQLDRAILDGASFVTCKLEHANLSGAQAGKVKFVKCDLTGAQLAKTDLAWALHAGLAYRVSNNFTIELAYRYLDLGSAITGGGSTFTGGTSARAFQFNNLTSQDVRLGVRWTCCDVEPPPPPLIRKG